MGKRSRRRQRRAGNSPATENATQSGSTNDDALGLLGLLLVYPFACWGLFHTSRTVWRIVTTGSTCPGRRCVSWDDSAVSVAMLLFCNVAFTVMLAAIVIGGFVTLLRGGRMD